MVTVAFGSDADEAFLREIADQRVRYTSDLIGIGTRLLGIVPDIQDDPTGVKRVENHLSLRPAMLYGVS